MTSYCERRPAVRYSDGLSVRDRNVARKEHGASVRFGHGVIEMAGMTVAGVEVLSRAANASGTACWRCRFIACGCCEILTGIQLRQYDRNGLVVQCKTHGKRSGAARVTPKNALSSVIEKWDAWVSSENEMFEAGGRGDGGEFVEAWASVGAYREELDAAIEAARAATGGKNG